MRSIRSFLPAWFMLPASVIITLFFVIPVFMTFAFSFTTMSSDTGVLGNRYIISEATLLDLTERKIDPILIEQLGKKRYVIDEANLEKISKLGLKKSLLSEIGDKLRGKAYSSEKKLYAALKKLKNRPRSFKDRKAISKASVASLMNLEFLTTDAFRLGLAANDIQLDDAAFDQLSNLVNTSWHWTTDNYAELFASDFTLKILGNTFFYVFFTLFIFNVGFALVLALSTFYMPRGHAKFFRALWLIPRISPSVIYVLLWKWFTFDSGFMSHFLGSFGVEGQDWLKAYPWTFVIIANGFVGASMGMLIFSSAVLAIPGDVLRAAEVDGAYPLQQIRRIILPLLAWPILFVTSYQTLSLLTSFEYILLLTDGGPGFFTTETWALNAFHTALSNYWGNLRYGYGATLAVVLVVVGIALSLLYLRLFNFKELVTDPQIEN